MPPLDPSPAAPAAGTAPPVDPSPAAAPESPAPDAARAADAAPAAGTAPEIPAPGAAPAAGPTPESGPAPGTAPAAGPTPPESGPAPDAVVAGIVRELATVLGVDPGLIDPGRPFRALGVGSVPAVRFVSLVNRRYGTGLSATALAVHPTPLDFAALVAREAGDGAAGAGPDGDGAGAGAGGDADAAEREVLGVLRERLAALLGCEPAAIDPATPFELLGVDSIRAAKFAAAVNDAYGMDERVVPLCEYPNLAAMAARLADSGSAARPPAPDDGQAAEEMGALLDAVRAERISVDEALTRLPHRP